MGAVAFAGDVDTAASDPTTSTCTSGSGGVELPARGMGFGLTAHAAE
ncbi:hypothetical protein [Ornithinimicrobium cerasi]|nr:hypothetical protein [Ornithinimicrobium cerasi]